MNKLDDEDEPLIKDVCKHACIYDLKAGRDIIKSKRPNNESDGFPFIEDEELKKALSIACMRFALNSKDKKKIEDAKKEHDGIDSFQIGNHKYVEHDD